MSREQFIEFLRKNGFLNSVEGLIGVPNPQMLSFLSSRDNTTKMYRSGIAVVKGSDRFLDETHYLKVVGEPEFAKHIPTPELEDYVKEVTAISLIPLYDPSGKENCYSFETACVILADLMGKIARIAIAIKKDAGMIQQHFEYKSRDFSCRAWGLDVEMPAPPNTHLEIPLETVALPAGRIIETGLSVDMRVGLDEGTWVLSPKKIADKYPGCIVYSDEFINRWKDTMVVLKHPNGFSVSHEVDVVEYVSDFLNAASAWAECLCSDMAELVDDMSHHYNDISED